MDLSETFAYEMLDYRKRRPHSNFSLENFILRVCLASLVYYSLWSFITYVYELTCNSEDEDE